MNEWDDEHHILFSLGDLIFEYDQEKEQKNLRKHKLSLKLGARVFFDEFRVELDDIAHSDDEQRFDVIGYPVNSVPGGERIRIEASEDILFVVYTERGTMIQDGQEIDVIRLISARLADNFERGIYYGNYY